MPEYRVVRGAVGNGVEVWRDGQIIPAYALEGIDVKRLLRKGVVAEASADNAPPEADLLPMTAAQANSVPPLTSGGDMERPVAPDPADVPLGLPTTGEPRGEAPEADAPAPRRGRPRREEA